jgi:hypothetical protein
MNAITKTQHNKNLSEFCAIGQDSVNNYQIQFVSRANLYSPMQTVYESYLYNHTPKTDRKRQENKQTKYLGNQFLQISNRRHFEVECITDLDAKILSQFL